MKYLVVFILLAVGLCEATISVSQIFNETAKTLVQYCLNSTETVSGRNLTSNELSQVEKVKIRGCNGSVVLNLAKQLPNLRVFDISYSDFQNLDWLNLTFDRLQIFNASHNNLSTCSYPFSQTPEVIEIDLSYNHHLQRDTLPYFVGLNNLKKLHLSNNDIVHSVDRKHFDAINLEYIDLKNNKLLSIPNLANKEHLRELHLEENPISYYFCTHIGQKSYPLLTSLYFSWKSVDFFGNSNNRCEEKRIRIVQNDTHEGIFIASSGRFEMHCKDICLESIFTFRAGRNAFENITDVVEIIGPTIRTMDLSNNFIGEFNTTSFERFINLDELNLSETNLTLFNFRMLTNCYRLSYLDISNNNLKELINYQLLQNLRLQVLNISGNQIENVNGIIEYLNPSLKELHVSGNLVGEITVNTFQILYNLQRLSMKNTNLTLPSTWSVRSNPFETLRNLKSLDLSQNNLENVMFSTLSATLYGLSELTLSDCRIKNISEVIQCLGPSLRKLDLSKNYENIARELDNQTFQKLEGLEDLNLSQTNLLSIDSSQFKYQSNLVVLDLSNNKLKTFDLKMLNIDDFHPYRLNLEGNDLTELKNLQESNYKIICFKLAKNQFPCPYLKDLSRFQDSDLLDESCIHVDGFSTNAKGIFLLEESWLQKDGRDCRSTTQSINDFLTSVYGKVKFW